MKTIRIGSGAGYGGDRLEPALELMEKGSLDYIGFECLAERTIALAQKEKMADSAKGYNPLLEYRMEQVLPLAWKHKVKVITNMGAANPAAAAAKCIELARKHGCAGMKIAAVMGDDVLDCLDRYQHTELWETHRPLKELDGEIMSANVYMGVDGILQALQAGADVVITGRVSDPSLFMAPVLYEFGWALDDWDKLGKATQVGHLLECGGQVCGGYFAEPGKKDVPDLAHLGFPIAEVGEDGSIVITKVPGSGGMVTRETCIEQMMYEIQDPTKYFTPDVVADFSNVTFTELGPDRVRAEGATGHPKTATLKTSIGYKDCFIGEGEISYGGPNCYARAELAAKVLEQRLALRKLPLDEVKIDLIGVNSLNWNPDRYRSTDPDEIRVRVAARTRDKTVAARIGEEVEAMYTNGPAGGCGAVKRVTEIVSVASMLVSRNDVTATVCIKEV